MKEGKDPYSETVMLTTTERERPKLCSSGTKQKKFYSFKTDIFHFTVAYVIHRIIVLLNIILSFDKNAFGYVFTCSSTSFHRQRCQQLRFC